MFLHTNTVRYSVQSNDTTKMKIFGWADIKRLLCWGLKCQNVWMNGIFGNKYLKNDTIIQSTLFNCNFSIFFFYLKNYSILWRLEKDYRDAWIKRKSGKHKTVIKCVSEWMTTRHWWVYDNSTLLSIYTVFYQTEITKSNFI